MIHRQRAQYPLSEQKSSAKALPFRGTSRPIPDLSLLCLRNGCGRDKKLANTALIVNNNIQNAKKSHV